MIHVHRHKDEPVAVQSVTSAPESLEQEQAHRIKRYLVTMGVRTVCFLGAVFTGTSGAPWWVWGSLAVAAVLLPYVAVVFANAVSPRAPGSSMPVMPSTDVPRQIGPDHPDFPGTRDTGDDEPRER